MVVARGELERALAWTTTNINTAVAIIIAGAIPAVVVLVTSMKGVMAVPVVIGGAGVGIGVVKLVRALRARSTIRSKLLAQRLPSARLLGK